MNSKITAKSIIENHFYNCLMDRFHGVNNIKSRYENLINKVLVFFFDNISLEVVTCDNGEKRFSKARLYNHYFDLGRISKNDCRTIIYLYLYSLVRECIRKYESIFKKRFVVNENEVRKSLIEMFKTKKFDINKCLGLSFYISLIPESVISGSLNEYQFLL